MPPPGQASAVWMQNLWGRGHPHYYYQEIKGALLCDVLQLRFTAAFRYRPLDLW